MQKPRCTFKGTANHRTSHTMQLIFIRLLVLLLATLGSALGQGTIVVTFDVPPAMPPGSSSPLGFYTESGVDVHVTRGVVTRRWSGDPLFPDNGTAYLQAGSSNGLYLNYIGGGSPFNAVSVDLAPYSASSLDPVTVEFVGFAYGGPIIATAEFTVTLDGQGRPAFQTFSFPQEFHGMHSLWIAPPAPAWSLDNLVISPIPEPSTTALLFCGGALLAGHWLRRFRKRK